MTYFDRSTCRSLPTTIQQLQPPNSAPIRALFIDGVDTFAWIDRTTASALPTILPTTLAAMQKKCKLTVIFSSQPGGSVQKCWTKFSRMRLTLSKDFNVRDKDVPVEQRTDMIFVKVEQTGRVFGCRVTDKGLSGVKMMR